MRKEDYIDNRPRKIEKMVNNKIFKIEDLKLYKQGENFRKTGQVEKLNSSKKLFLGIANNYHTSHSVTTLDDVVKLIEDMLRLGKLKELKRTLFDARLDDTQFHNVGLMPYECQYGNEVINATILIEDNRREEFKITKSR